VKKIAKTLFIFICQIIFLTSCLGKSDTIVVKDKLLNILSALETKDSGTVKEAFSKVALANSTDLDKQIENAIKFFEYPYLTIDNAGDGASSTNSKYAMGKVISKDIQGIFDMTTKEGKYLVFIHY